MGTLNAGILVLTATATGGGLWFVVRLIVRYQHQFLEAYAARIVTLETKVSLLEEDREKLTQRLTACTSERAMLRAVVRQAGIKWNPADWDDNN